MICVRIVLASLFIYTIFCLSAIAKPTELRWNWNNIPITQISFPKNFLWGCSDSAMQTEGHITSNNKITKNSWTEYEALMLQKGEIKNTACVGNASDRWKQYKSDIKLLKNLGMNAYRFSIEWSKIQPHQGVFDSSAMKHYIDEIDELLAQNITPIVTLFHHTYPVWFAQKGAFEHKDNISHFLTFARYVFCQLRDKVKIWIIFNEPVAYAIEGYFRGNYPPGKKSLRLAGKVAKNMLNAHVTVAQEFKRMDNSIKVGIAHIINPLDHFNDWNVFERISVKIFDYIVNDLTLDFFRTGKFNWLLLVRGHNKNAPQSLDFIGINYYTHTVIKQTSFFKIEPHRRMDETIISPVNGQRGYKTLYPEGMYRAIQKASLLNIPLYITENGCAEQDGSIRDEYIKKHLYVVSQAIKEGYNIRGYFFWTLIDCFGWKKGYADKHGLYGVNFDTQERTFRPSGQYLVDVIKNTLNKGVE